MNKKLIVLTLSLIGINLFSCKKKDLVEEVVIKEERLNYIRCSYCKNKTMNTTSHTHWSCLYSMKNPSDIIFVCNDCKILVYDLILGRKNKKSGGSYEEEK